MIRALFLDLDGTLINHTGGISARVQQAVAEVSKKMWVSIATGREPSHVVYYARQLNLTTPQIGDGGAVILDPATGDFLWSASLPAHDARAMITEFARTDTRFHATYPGGSGRQVSELPHWNITRVSALGLIEAAADALAARLALSGMVETNKSYLPDEDLWAVDITPRGVDKGTAARRVAGMLGVEGHEIAAIGDSYNDIPLLEYCGLAVAMGNAPPAVAAVADHIVPTADEDGVAVAIERLILSGAQPLATD